MGISIHPCLPLCFGTIEREEPTLADKMNKLIAALKKLQHAYSENHSDNHSRKTSHQQRGAKQSFDTALKKAQTFNSTNLDELVHNAALTSIDQIRRTAEKLYRGG